MSSNIQVYQTKICVHKAPKHSLNASFYESLKIYPPPTHTQLKFSLLN